MRVDDVAGNGHGMYYSPRHAIPSNSRHEGLKCVSMTWRAIFACPYSALRGDAVLVAALAVAPHEEHVAVSDAV
jgi:hypothetical protein